VSSGAPDGERELGRALEFLRALWALDHALEKTSKRIQAAIGVTAEQRMILRIVGRQPAISSGQLADLLHLDAGTISAALRRLESRRLIVRRRDPKDGRRVTVDLTRQGRKLDVPLVATVESAVETVLSRSRAEELAHTEKVLARLVVALDGAR
jgi:DNA-binding MarR family transcriptional regulator